MVALAREFHSIPRLDFVLNTFAPNPDFLLVRVAASSSVIPLSKSERVNSMSFLMSISEHSPLLKNVSNGHLK